MERQQAALPKKITEESDGEDVNQQTYVIFFFFQCIYGWSLMYLGDLVGVEVKEVMLGGVWGRGNGG